MNESLLVDSSLMVRRRPHIRKVTDKLYFLISRRPLMVLDEDEQKLWDALAKKPTVGELRESIGPDADRLVERLRAVEACEFTTAKYPAGRRRVLVIEPHCDDAILSVGGVMWKRRFECEFTVSTLASRSNFTSYYFSHREFFNVDLVSEIRRNESEFAVAMIGGKYMPLGHNEAPLRYRSGDWSLEWFRAYEMSILNSIGRRYPAEELEAWTRTVTNTLEGTDADEWWLPLGVGKHADHQLARDACFQALSKLSISKPTRLYVEVPYVTDDPAYNEQLVQMLRSAGAKLDAEPVPIDDAFAAKMRLISAYGSQFKTGVMRPKIEASARFVGSRYAAPFNDSHREQMSELLWRLHRAPDRLDISKLWPGYETCARQQPKLARWKSRNRDAPRLRMLLLFATGRWRVDFVSLERLFPKADFEIYVSASGLAEVAEVKSMKGTVRLVRNGRREWLLLAVKLAFSKGMPTLFLSGARRQGAARLIAKFWLRSDTFVLSSMDELVHATES